jgi:calcium-dependent protein kinase
MGDDIYMVREEIKILQTLDHPNIIKYYETFENNRYMYLVMEYCPGGELFDLIAKTVEKHGIFNESKAAEIM